MILAIILSIAIASTNGFVFRHANKPSPSVFLKSSSTPNRFTASPFFSTISTDQIEETWSSTASLIANLFKLPATPLSIVELCDRIDTASLKSRESVLLGLRRQALLATMLKKDRNEYLETVRFLGPRIPRNDLPNLQDVPYFDYQPLTAPYSIPIPVKEDDDNDVIMNSDEILIKDCSLPNTTFSESPLDILLLGIFRNLVQKEVLYKSELPGIKGLLEEGKFYYISELGAITENQHAFVRRTLGALLTPFLPPFYRIFMAGIIPSVERGDPQWLADGTLSLLNSVKNISFIGDIKWVQDNLVPGAQLGPLFYAPLLTSIVTPPFLNFLVGPSKTNRRKDGEVGGIVVEKCKFLQESGCKGLCLHQCKLPAQQFFKRELGLSLTVIPDFNTQACQWSWGEEPIDADLDPAFPKGCLSNCPTRSQINENEKENENTNVENTMNSNINDVSSYNSNKNEKKKKNLICNA